MMKKSQMIDELKAKHYPVAGMRGIPKERVREIHEAICVRGAPEHLSWTQINTYLTCPRRYFFRYKLNLKIKPIWKMVLGGCADKAFNHFYENKIEKGEDEPESVLHDVFQEDWKKNETETVFEEKKPNEVEGLGHKIVGTFREELGLRTEPIATQKHVEVMDDRGIYRFEGFIDLVARENDQPAIIDHKTSGRKPQAEVAASSTQICGYAFLAAQDDDAKPPYQAGLDFLVYNEKSGAVQTERQRATFTPADFSRFWDQVGMVWRAIEAGAFFYAPQQINGRPNWNCTPVGCGYWHICHDGN
jgi:putative RecB family exonuclease